jgi:acyl-coenzyme A synthetase/AMP-(fatty) acid ligase
MVSLPEKTILEALVSGPLFPDRQFIRQGCSFGDVHGMAARLREVLGPGDGTAPVCLAAENKGVMAAALLASLGGGPEILLPYGLSQRALARLQQATGFTTAIVDTALDVPANVRVLSPETAGSAAASLSPPVPERGLLKIFTGGSTGSPQIWAKTAENIFAEAIFLARHFSVTEQDCIVATIPPCHIYGLLFSVVLPLVSGASVIEGTPCFPGDISEAFREHRGTILASVPSHYRVLRERNLTGSGLRLAVSSAGMLDEEDNRAFSLHNSPGIVEVYGSTETGGIAMRNRSRGEAHFTAFPTVSWKISEGCLAVRSPYISPGLSLDSDGFFVTADRVEPCGPDGFLLKGRADSVTKVGGRRVDLDEVRMCIKKQAGVTDCVVVALPGSGGRGHVVGALVQGKDVNAGHIRDVLADILEPYALPRLMKIVSQIPMQENGKYDRDAILDLLKP